MMRRNLMRAARAGLLVPGCLVLAACGSATQWQQADGPPATPVTQSDSNQPDAGLPPQGRSARGNPPFYEVFGQRYHVMQTSAGFSERGVASWYGKKFHGRPTSSGVPYNMHAMTAAHKTLPLPTRVRVTNLRNGRSVIVMVNDRGPFVDDRIIDLSYAAATQLDMVRSGTTLVEIEALPFNQPMQPVLTASEPRSAYPELIATARADTPVGDELPTPNLFLQVGAFGDKSNAVQLKQQLETRGMSNVVIHYVAGGQSGLYRVRVGPIADVATYDELVKRVTRLDIRNPHLVNETNPIPLTDTSSGG